MAHSAAALPSAGHNSQASRGLWNHCPSCSTGILDFQRLFQQPAASPLRTHLLCGHAGCMRYSLSCTGTPGRTRWLLGGRPVCGRKVQSRSSSSSLAWRSCRGRKGGGRVVFGPYVQVGRMC